MSGFLKSARVTATVNLLVLSGLGALLFHMDSGLDRRLQRGGGFYLGLLILGLLGLFWLWMFVVNPREWAVVKDGRLLWRRGHVFSRRGSAAVDDISLVLVETVITSSDPGRPGSFNRNYVVLKDGTKLRVPESAVEPGVLDSMRRLNPGIEKRSESRPFL